jgi:hypothetical protein
LTIIAAIVDPTVIAKILKHLGMSVRHRNEAVQISVRNLVVPRRRA